MYVFSSCPFFFTSHSANQHIISTLLHTISQSLYIFLLQYISPHYYCTAHQLKGFSVPKLPLNFTLSLPKNEYYTSFYNNSTYLHPYPYYFDHTHFFDHDHHDSSQFYSISPLFSALSTFFLLSPEKIVLHHPTVFQEYSTPTAATSLNYFLSLFLKKLR